MTFRVDAGFDVGAFGALRISDGGDKFDILSGLFCHLNLESLFAIGVYSDLASQINAELFALGITATVAYNTTSGRYVITAGGGPVNLTMGVDEVEPEHVRMGQVLGFSTSPGAIAGGASVTGDITPYFSIHGAMGGVSNASDTYEGGTSEVSEAESGRAYGVASTSAPTYSDFTVPYEPRAAVYIRAAEATAPWTWEHLITHCRVTHPFAITDDFGEGVGVHQLMPSSDRFRPKRVNADWRERHNLDFKTREIGRV